MIEAIDTCDHITSFTITWVIMTDRFTVLQNFCTGIAITFPNTTTVEADFFNILWEKNDFRKSLIDLSLKRILQYK